MNARLIESLAQVILSLSDEERNLLWQKLNLSSDSIQPSPGDIREEPFVGMWSDREEMADSTTWVRNLRQQHWMTDNAATDSH